MSGARPSAGRRVLAFPCVSAPGVRAASRLGELRCPAPPLWPPSPSRAPPEALPGWNETGAPEEAAGGSRGLQRPRRGRGGDAGPVRTGGGGGVRTGIGKPVGKGGQGQPAVGARAGTYREQSRAPGWQRAQSSPGVCSCEGPPQPSPLSEQLGKTLFPAHPTRLERLQ